MSISLSIEINGKKQTSKVNANVLLVDFLRDSLKLTGTHIGCDTAQCGACTIHINGEAIKSCNILAAQAHGTKITTIEGLTTDDKDMHPMQQAFKNHHGLQCGFCTPGMIMSALQIIKNDNDPSDAAIREGLEGNLCRCTGYHNIVEAIKAGAKAMQNKG